MPSLRSTGRRGETGRAGAGARALAALRGDARGRATALARTDRAQPRHRPLSTRGGGTGDRARRGVGRAGLDRGHLRGAGPVHGGRRPARAPAARPPLAGARQAGPRVRGRGHAPTGPADVGRGSPPGRLQRQARRPALADGVRGTQGREPGGGLGPAHGGGTRGGRAGRLRAQRAPRHRVPRKPRLREPLQILGHAEPPPTSPQRRTCRRCGWRF